MNKSKISICLIVLFFSSAFGVYSQQGTARIEFRQKEHDFGNIRETDGITSYGFIFTNTGNQPLYITKVLSGCGCANAEYSDVPVPPGGQGAVIVNFDPMGRVGAFNELIQIYSNSASQTEGLIVRGVVIPVVKMEDVFRYRFGDFFIEDIYLSFGEVYKGNEKVKHLRLFNNSKTDTLKPLFYNVPEHINFEIRPSVLGPQEDAVVTVHYNSQKLDDWDFVIDRINMARDSGYAIDGIFSVTANIKEDFSELSSEEINMAPVAGFDNTVFNFGNIIEKAVITHHFTLKNNGGRDLYIRKISASCGCTAVTPEVSVIPPGESTRITVVFNAAGQLGEQRKAITVITNDPKRSRTILWIEGNVEKQ